MNESIKQSPDFLIYGNEAFLSKDVIYCSRCDSVSWWAPRRVLAKRDEVPG